MKNIILIRHGKSELNNLNIADIDRHLIPRGISDGYKVGNFIAEKWPQPEAVLTSNACRALHTATIICRSINLDTSLITIKDDLYLAYQEHILKVISKTPDNINTVMIVGHNPGMTELVNAFNRYVNTIHNLPTTGAYWFKLDSDNWQDFSSIKKEASIHPKQIKSKV